MNKLQTQKIKRKLKAFSLLLFIGVSPILYGALNKVHPLSATADLRVKAYVDAFKTVTNSTFTVNLSTWTYDAGNNYIYVSPTLILNGLSGKLVDGVFSTTKSTWTLQAYTDIIVNQAKIKLINQVLKQDVEQYMVWPSTTPPPVGQWLGWCLDIVNGKKVPIVCKD